MKSNTFYFSLLLVFSFLSFQSCEKDDEYEVVISDYGDDDSHKTGQNCMTCHVSGGQAEGYFSVAGSIYNTSSSQNVDVILSTEANGMGTVVASVKVDALGNFYTTENVDFGSGLYTTIKYGTNSKTMITPINTGQCNSCHGNSVGNIEL